MNKWYQNNILLLLAIFFLAPLGIYGLFKRNTKRPILKIIAIIISLAYFIFYFFMSIGLIIMLFMETDKINYDAGLRELEEGKLEKAQKSFSDIDSDSEYYNDAIIKLRLVDSLLVVQEQNKQIEKEIAEKELQAKKEQELKLKQEIIDIRNNWSDSVVKSWEGQFITGYKKDSKDSILFFLSKNASKSFQSNRDTHIPMLEKSYKNYMNKKLPNKNIGKITIDFIQDPKIKEKIKNQAERNEKFSRFFGFKGQHRNLERLIKNNMNDPDSYEHVNTRWEDKGSYLLIETTIRGTNAFGAKIIKTYRAKSDLEGNIFDVSE